MDLSTTLLVYQGDHAGAAVADLLGQHQQRPRMVAFTRALAAAVQQQEDIAFSVLSSTLAICDGHRLDQWGDLVGEPRDGLQDHTYRNFISARIMANRSSGKLDELIEIAQIITAPSKVVSFELYPKLVGLNIYRDSWLPETWRRKVGRMLRAIHPAGTFLELVEVITGDVAFDDIDLGFELGHLSRII